MKKILLTGANGQVGWELARSLQPLGTVTALRRDDLDLANPVQIRECVERIAPDLVINAAAYTAVDRAEDEATLAFTVNRDAVAVLAEATRRCNGLFVHFSTDYIFDGKKPAPYTESDLAQPENIYGLSKRGGEEAIEHVGGDWLIFRTTWVYGARGQNFLRTMLKLGSSRESLSVVCDQYGAPTSARLIADLTAQASNQAMAEREKEVFQSGVFHMTARGMTSWHGFAKAIFSGARARASSEDLRVREIHPIPASEYPTKAVRPQNSVLDNGKFDSRFGFNRPDWSESLNLVLDDLYSR